VPAADPTNVSIDVSSIMVVSVLLSNEYPIEVTLSDEHVVAVAERVNGDVTSELLAGLLTVTPACAGTARITKIDNASDNFWTMLIELLCNGRRY
jgi:hypothetical protein